MIEQMDLVIKAVSQTSTTANDKDVALSILADIVKKGCEDCEMMGLKQG
jgi:hypothetical protein